MSYRPLTDMWFLARAKLKNGRKFYGAYLGGFPERARALLSATIHEPVLHVCGGMARMYPYSGGFGVNDKTLDIDDDCQPDFHQDARLPLPTGFKAMLIDPPYSPEDAKQYRAGPDAYPSPSLLIANALDALEPGCRAGIIHYSLPRQPKRSRFVACVGVACGFGNRLRCYSVFERT